MDEEHPRALPPDIARQIEKLVQQSLEKPVDWFGPLPPDRWLNLPQHQRDWLTGKSRAELDRFDVMLKVDPGKMDAVLKLDSDRLSLFVREFDAEDIADLKEAVRFARSARTVGRFWRVLLLTVAGVVGMTWTFGQQIAGFWKLITTGAVK